MLWRLVRTILLLGTGTIAGFAAAAAMLRGWLRSRGDEASDELTLVAIFDGVELVSRADAFRGGSVLAWFGGVTVDLRGATPAPGAVLEVRCTFGGAMITVPPDWRVDARTTAIAGGIDVQPPASDTADGPTLEIRATCVFGGVAVKR